MSREASWTEENYKDWLELLDKPGFKTLAKIATKGLSKVDPSDVKGLVAESRVLSSHENPSVFRRDFRLAIQGVEPQSRRSAVEALMRSSEESQRMTADGAQRLARVFLGEADESLARIAKELGKAEDELKPTEKTQAVTGDNEAFRRSPKPTSRPGERMLLLRDLYDQLFPPQDSSSPPAAPMVTDQPRDDVTYSDSKEDLQSIRRVLQRHYDTTLEPTRFASIVIDDHRAIENLTMNIVLRDCDEDYYWFDVQRDFSARFDRYFIGIAAGTKAHRTVMRHVPELRDLIWLPGGTDLDTEVDKLIREGMLMTRDTTTAIGYRAMVFTEIPEDDPVAVRLREDGLEHSEYRLLEAEGLNPDELLKYRSALCMRLRRERRRCTWYADGPTYVDKVTIETAEFTDAAESPNLSVAYFLPGNDLSHGPDRFNREVQSWVVRHHGLTISW